MPRPFGDLVTRVALLLTVVALIAPPVAALALDVGTQPPHGENCAAMQAMGLVVDQAPRGCSAQVRSEAAAASEGGYRILFRCPETVGGTGVPAACPAYVLDREDILSQPILVIDPNNPEDIAFHALHGGRGIHPLPNAQPPSSRSRDDQVHQPHTTFRSTDGGKGWEDMPYHAPDSLQDRRTPPQREIYGEDNAATLDAQGRLTLASLYSYREGAATPTGTPGPFQYVIGAWKSHPIGKGPVDYHVNVKLLTPSENATRVDSLHATYVRGSDVITLTWREENADGSTIALRWSRPQDGALWNAADIAIGPCSAVSNPLAYESLLFIACRPNATAPWEMRAIDTALWSVTDLGATPLSATHATLVERGQSGFMMLIGSGVRDDGSPTVAISYGEQGARWSSPEEIGHDLTLAAGAPILDARVTAASYHPQSGNIHLIYLERHEITSTNADGASQPEFAKVFAAVKAEGTFQGKIDLQLGTVSRVDYSPTLTGAASGAFDDLHDGIVVWKDPKSGRTREYIAFGDYGYARFAEVVEENFLSPLAIPIAQVPPVPVASAGTAPVLVGLGAGVIAGSMVARTMWARRKSTVEAPTE